MQRNKQLISDKDSGDCHRACVTSILEIPNDPKFLPNASAKDWFVQYRKFLRPFGLSMVYDEKSIWRSGYWIASVPSMNYEGVFHSIVMFGSDVTFDPSTKKRYESGTSMVGKDIVKGGFWFEAEDPTKLHKLDIFRQKEKEKRKRKSFAICECGDYEHQHKKDYGCVICSCKIFRKSGRKYE